MASDFLSRVGEDFQAFAKHSPIPKIQVSPDVQGMLRSTAMGPLDIVSRASSGKLLKA